MDDVVALILAGGIGSRLHPLTEDRAKPAVPFGGQYRIIDFALSNCLHSGVRRILVLPQYKSHSLMKHLRDGWSVFNPSLGEYITPVPPQMRTSSSWYQGTADAIFQNVYLLQRSGAKQILVLSGDHIYRMDYAQMLRHHVDERAEVSLACMKVPVEDARGFGVVKVDAYQRVIEFQEKPKDPATVPGNPLMSLASMGIYIFDCELLMETLINDQKVEESSHDFGKDILPKMIHSHAVSAYEFGGEEGRVTADRYWRDVGTIDSYFEANMDLLKPVPPIDLYQTDWPIRTALVNAPPARTCDGVGGSEPRLSNSIISPGAIVSGGNVENSILSPYVRVNCGAHVSDSILFDGVCVGAGAVVTRAIIEKGVSVPPNTVVSVDRFRGVTGVGISERGILVIPKGFTAWPENVLKPGHDVGIRRREKVLQ
ncbi:MAG: glucose-1-phosphate adenylyltransferase [Planctomycetaceae bacterium]|nr:glucose-1-phosphate adenylyltransferase [Planctomycetaceae bacterium]